MNRSILHLKAAIANVFEQVDGLLYALTAEQYRMPSKILFNASIGQHVRHIIELFIELDNGYQSGTVNYEKRKRDYRIETDKAVAAAFLTAILNTVERNNKQLVLEAGFSNNAEDMIHSDTNYYRELAYNIEHSIHHMALIRVGVNELSNIPLDENFGIASATIKYRSACVQ
jgi:hypothetical protein